MSLPTLTQWADTLFRGALIHVWESSLAGVAVLGIILACRRAPADLRRKLGWIGLLKFAIPAAALAPFLRGLEILAERLASGSPRTLLTEVLGYRLLSVGAASRGLYPSGLVYGILGLWGIVTSFLVIRWAFKAAVFRRDLIAAAEPASERLTRGLAMAAARAGLGTAPIAMIPSELEGPGILGIISPVLVIPRTLETGLSPGELESILVHELVHLRRRDHLWGAVRTCFLMVFWHNPVVWFLCRSIALETEKACDEEVILLTGAPQAYADGILKTVRHSIGPLDQSLTGAAGHSISSRIKSILNPRSKIESPAMKTIALSAACAIAVLSAYADTSVDSPPVPATGMPPGETFDIAKLDSAPRALSQARPVYPAEMKAHAISAKVLVDFIVDTSGAVRNAYAIKTECTTSGAGPEFAKSAVDAVSKWAFKPGLVAGRSVNTHLQVPIVYSLPPVAQGIKD